MFMRDSESVMCRWNFTADTVSPPRTLPKRLHIADRWNDVMYALPNVKAVSTTDGISDASMIEGRRATLCDGAEGAKPGSAAPHRSVAISYEQCISVETRQESFC